MYHKRIVFCLTLVFIEILTVVHGTARRASWIYEQAGQTPTYNTPDDARVRKGLEETTGHKDIINMLDHMARTSAVM